MSTRKRVTRSLARDDGINTLLLDIKQDLGVTTAEIRNLKEDHLAAAETRKAIQAELSTLNGSVTKLCATVGRLEPVVDTLNTEYQKKMAVSGALQGAFKKVHAVWIIVGGGVVAAFQYLFGK